MSTSNVYKVFEKDPLAHVDRIAVIMARSAQEAIDLFVKDVNDNLPLKRGAELEVLCYVGHEVPSRVLSWHICGYGDH